jgi:hypothetical protein
MSHGVVTTWTCDRCGRTEQIDNTHVPANWVELVKKTLPAHPQEEGRMIVSWEICSGCSDQVGRFMLGSKAPVDERITVGVE